MNIQELNLGLTIELMNNRNDSTSLNTFKNFMSTVKGAGRFIDSKLKNERTVGNDWRNLDYTLNYENCSLDINLTANSTSESKILRGFKFK